MNTFAAANSKCIHREMVFAMKLYTTFIDFEWRLGCNKSEAENGMKTCRRAQQFGFGRLSGKPKCIVRADSIHLHLDTFHAFVLHK